MSPKLELEAVRLFIAPSKRERCLQLAADSKTRNKFVDQLRSPAIFDERCLTMVSGADRTHERLGDFYKELGMGGRVYAISAHPDWDGRKFQMTYLLGATLAQGIDVLAYCWQTKTAFYEWHHSGASYFLRRPAKR